MFKVLDWAVQNWKPLVFLMTVGFLLGMIKPITNWLRNIKESLREIFTPLGFLVFLTLIGFAIFLIFAWKNGLFDL